MAKIMKEMYINFDQNISFAKGFFKNNILKGFLKSKFLGTNKLYCL